MFIFSHYCMWFREYYSDNTQLLLRTYIQNRNYLSSREISISPVRDFPSQLQLFFLVGKNFRQCSKRKEKRNERSNELLLLENKIARFHPRQHQSLFQVIQPEKASRREIGVKALIRIIAGSLFLPHRLCRL